MNGVPQQKRERHREYVGNKQPIRIKVVKHELNAYAYMMQQYYSDAVTLSDIIDTDVHMSDMVLGRFVPNSMK